MMGGMNTLKTKRLRMNKVIRSFLFIFLSVVVVYSLESRVRTKQSAREFDTQLAKTDIMVVLFYEGKPKTRRLDRVRDVSDRLLRVYESVSNRKRYDDADVTFVKVNASESNSTVLINRYNIDHFPTYMIFINGKMALDSEGKYAVYKGAGSEQEIESFINYYCDSTINDLIAQREQMRDIKLKESQDESNPYFYPATVYTQTGDVSTWQKPLRNGTGSKQ